MKLQIKVAADGTIEEAVFKVPNLHPFQPHILCCHHTTRPSTPPAAASRPASNLPVALLLPLLNSALHLTQPQTFGCGSAIASSSVATEWVKGMNIDEATKIKNTEIANHLNLPPVKLHCSMLAEDAIKAAVKDFKAKREARAAA